MSKNVIITIIGLLLLGCAKVTTIRTRPSGARIFITEKDTSNKEIQIIRQNKYIGLSPASLTWDTRHEYTIRAIVENFFPKEQTFTFSDPPKEVVLVFDQPNPSVIKFGR